MPRARVFILFFSLLVLSLFVLIGYFSYDQSAFAQTATIAAPSTTVTVDNNPQLTRVLKDCWELRANGELEAALAKANLQLTAPGTGHKDSVRLLEVVAMCHYSKGSDFYETAYSTLEQMSSVDHCAWPLPGPLWPQGLEKRWYSIGYSNDRVCREKPAKNTIAILPFKNRSIPEYLEKLGDQFGAFLADAFLVDFQKISSFDVLERAEIEAILEEQDLALEGLVDKYTAVEIGKILGAQYLVFGNFAQTGENDFAVSARVASVETSKLFPAVDEYGKPRYYKMVKSLVPVLCKNIDIALSPDEQKQIKSGGSDSNDAAELFATGLLFEYQIQYDSAYAYFDRAVGADPDYEEAKRKMQTYAPLVGKS